MSGEVCRFFLQGRCRYGSRCRYLHQRGPTSGGRGDYAAQQSSSSSSSFSHDRRGYDHRGAGRDSNRFDYLNSDPSRGNRGRGRFGGYSRDSGYGNRGPSGGGYDDRGGRYGDRDGGYGNRGPSSGDRGGRYGDRDGGYGNRGPSSGGYGDRGGRYGNRDGGFGNRGPSSGGYGDRGGAHDNRGPAEPTSPEELAQVIREDMETWAESQMWPFSCYSCGKEVSCVPRLEDLSPEELRWKAYLARQDPAAQAAYHEELRSLQEKVMGVRRELRRITPDSVQALLSGQSGGGSTLFGTLSPSSLFPPTSPSTLFQSHGQQPQSSIFGSGDNSSVVTGSLLGRSSPGLPNISTLTQTTTTKAATVTVASSSTASTQLSEEELKAFRSEHFDLGKIPETPPLPELV